MSQQLLRQVLRLADAPSSVSLTYDDVMRWPEAIRRALLDGWVRDDGTASRYACTGCDRECTDDVQWVERGVAGEREGFIPCPSGLGRIRVRTEELRQWVVDARMIAAKLCAVLATRGAPQEVVKERLWWLGRPTFGRQSLPVFLVRGASRADAAATFAEVAALKETPCLALCFADSPKPDAFAPSVKLLSLSRLLRIDGTAVGLDAAALGQAVPKTRARTMAEVAPIHTPPGTAWGQVMIEFLDAETVRISVPEHSGERSFAAMGFQDHRKVGEQADVLWELLRLLAKEQGQLTPADSRRSISAARFGNVKKYIADTRARLRALFPDIEGDPFKPYRKVKAYETQFVLRWAGGERQP